jgi:transcriptional regulator with AAA-type ATPase domain/tetratricopeptide (TPR) repeat protein
MNPLADLLGDSAAIEAVRREIRRLLEGHPAGRRLPSVLIQGETGTGKGLVARVLHRGGPRADGPFVDVNCAAIPDTLLEAELFGFERGAFTDARRSKPGLFHAAHRGAIFLDEVGLLPEALQAKLLSVLEERSVRRLGATRAEPVDVWVLSATNADLRAAVQARRFREDLYHRLTVLTLTLPALRDRGDDVLLLAERFLARACQEYGLPAKRLAPDAQARLLAYRWPGNVRELGNVIERVALLAERDVVTADVLGLDVPADVPAAPEASATPDMQSADEAAGEHLRATLERTGWNISRTAAVLGLSRNTVRARIARFGLVHGAPAGAPPSPARRAPRPAPSRVTPPAPAEARPEAPATPAPIRWERRPVTFARAAAVVGEEEQLVDTSRALDMIVDKFRTFGGRIEEIGQGSVDASFGLEPIDDAPRRAANAALAILNAAAPGGETAQRVRVAMHAASVLVGHASGRSEIDRADKRAIGQVLDDLLAAAEPATILVSAPTTSLLDRGFDLTPFARRAAPIGAARLLGRGGLGLGLWGRIGGFVGRRQELELLEARWSAAARGSGQVVGVVGDPGVGKSRLLWEFTRSIPPSSVVLQAAAVALGTPTPYLPFVELLRDYLRVEPGEPAAAVTDKVRRSVHALDPAFAPVVPAILALLDASTDDPAWAALDPRQRRQRTLDSVKALLLRESRRQPVALVVEDAHWLDSESQAVLDTLVDGLPTARLLLLVSYRPEYRHGWGARTYYTQLRVDPLPGDGAEGVLRGVLGDDASLAGLVPRLIEWTGGNPLFLEEAVRNLVEMGALVGEWGAYRLVVRVPELEVPRTVEGVLAARIDRLVADRRQLLGAAAVIGRDVPRALLASVTKMPDEALDGALADLREAELLYETSTLPDVEYTFKHALIHEVVYRGVAETPRRELHQAALVALESMYAGRRDERLDDLARHAFEGHVWPSAADYFRRAGHRAFERYANRQAAAHFERALAACARLPVTPERQALEIDLHFEVRNALTPLGELALTLEHLEAAATLAERLGDKRRLGRAGAFMANCLYQMGEQRRAIEAGEAALAVAEALGDVALRTAAEMYVGRAWLFLGQFPRAIELFERIAGFLAGPRARESLGLPVLPAVFARSHLVIALSETGDFDRASAVAREALELAESSGHPDTLLWALRGLGLLHLAREESEQARHVLERAHHIGRANDLTTYAPPIASALGAALVQCGRAPEALGLLDEAVALAAALKQVTNEAEAVTRLGMARLAAGDVDGAMESADLALALARQRGERGTVAHAAGLKGAVLARAGRSAAAQEAYREALAEADTLGMRPAATRCRSALGALLLEAGKTGEAVDLLQAAARSFLAMGMGGRAAEAQARAARAG